MSSAGQAVKTSFPIISWRKSVGLSPPVTTVQHSGAAPRCKVRQKVNANTNDKSGSRRLGRRALPAGFLLPGISCLDISGLYASVHILCLFSSFIFLYLLWSDCFHNKKQPAKKMNSSYQTPGCRPWYWRVVHCGWDLVSWAFIPAVLWKMPQDNSLGACICPEGHEVLAHLSAPWRQGDVARGSRNATAHPRLHNWVLPTVSPCTLCEGWEKVSWGGLVLDGKLRFYLFLGVIRAFPAGRIPNWSLVAQLTARTQPARGERNVFQAIP